MVSTNALRSTRPREASQIAARKTATGEVGGNAIEAGWQHVSQLMERLGAVS